MRVKNDDLREKIKKYFEEYCEEKGYAPTVREVSSAMEITVNKAYRYLSDLESEGLIAKERGFVSKKLANKSDDYRIEILGQDKYISLPKTILNEGDYVFVQHEGTFYLVDKAKKPRKNSLVVAKENDCMVIGTYISSGKIRTSDDVEFSIDEITGVAIKELRNI